MASALIAFADSDDDVSGGRLLATAVDGLMAERRSCCSIGCGGCGGSGGWLNSNSVR